MMEGLVNVALSMILLKRAKVLFERWERKVSKEVRISVVHKKVKKKICMKKYLYNIHFL